MRGKNERKILEMGGRGIEELQDRWQGRNDEHGGASRWEEAQATDSNK